jgi:hypothetical protein
VETKNKDEKAVRATCDVLHCLGSARYIDAKSNLRLCEFCRRRCDVYLREYGETLGFNEFLKGTFFKPDAMTQVPRECIGDIEC